MLKLRATVASVREEFGYWVFEGDWQPSQRPSWNYKKQQGGGIILDMFCHWRYVLDQIVAPVRAVSALGVAHIPERFDERGHPYQCTAEDAAFGTFALEGGIVAQVNSSWAVRVHRDDVLTMQIDSAEGSAVPGLSDCWVQPRATTPRPIWNPDVPREFDYRAGWQEVPDNEVFDNAFKVQWELFLARGLQRAVPLDAARGRQRRAAGSAGAAVVARAPLAGRAGAGMIFARRLV